MAQGASARRMVKVGDGKLKELVKEILLRLENKGPNEQVNGNWLVDIAGGDKQLVIDTVAEMGSGTVRELVHRIKQKVK